MPDLVWVVLLLLPVAAASGWYIRDQRGDSDESPQTSVKADYLRGIRHLVNEESDQAIESFIRVLDVDDETVETHVALGNLFRRHGEVDRALRIHQNLVARPSLGTEYRNQARYELAHDYLKAGVLDRAEGLFRELVDDNVYLDRAMRGLITIYEQERDWARAIEITRRLETVRGFSLRPVIAQYYCELAEEARDANNPDDLRQQLKQSRNAYKDCVRATLLRGALAEQDDDPRLAIRTYRQVPKQDVDFTSEIIDPVHRCYKNLDELANYELFLSELMEITDAVQPHVAYARLLHDNGRTDEAVAHLSEYLQEQANWIGFHEMLTLARARANGGLTGPLDNLRQSLDGVIARYATYRCGHCGFSGQYLHWQCPSCRQWNSMAPLGDLKPSV